MKEFIKKIYEEGLLEGRRCKQNEIDYHVEEALKKQKQELTGVIEQVIQEERYAGAPYALNKVIEIIKNK